MSRTHIWLPLLSVVTFVFLAASPIRSAAGSGLLISDDAMSAMMELSLQHPYCRMHTDRGDIRRMLLQSDPQLIHMAPRDSVMELDVACRTIGPRGFSTILKLLAKGVRFVVTELLPVLLPDSHRQHGYPYQNSASEDNFGWIERA